MVYKSPGLHSGSSPPASYEIHLRGVLDARWSAWFNGTEITSEEVRQGVPVTRLISPPIDQAKLRGMLNKIWDLNLVILSVRRIERNGKERCIDD